LDNDAKLASARVEALSASLDQLKRQASSNNEQDVQLRALERDAKSQRDLLESYLAKYREATARDSIGAASPDARVISTATPSNLPSWPKKLPTVLVAALAMFALSVGFILTGELLSGAPVQPAAIREFAPVVATPVADPVVVPAAKVAWAPVAEPQPAAVDRLAAIIKPRASTPPAAGPDAPIEPTTTASAPVTSKPVASAPLQEPQAPPQAVDEVSVAAAGMLDPIENLASELSGAGEAGRRVTVLGARRNMGTTLTTITLARALAKQARVVLIDLALDAPGLSVIAADASGPGISELILGSASFGDIITRDRFSRVHVITAGRLKDDSAEIFNSPRLSITLEALARSYEYVVIDAGSLRNAPTERIAQFAPRAVLVADELDDPVTVSAHDALLAAGFANVSVLVSPPEGPQSNAKGTRAAA
jgi:Mrp family chromosome partitioning ATPase